MMQPTYSYYAIKSTYKFIGRLSWRERIKILLTGKMAWPEVEINHIKPVAKPTTLKWFPETPGWNDKKRMKREIKYILAMFSKRGMRNARRRLARMYSKAPKKETDIFD